MKSIIFRNWAIGLVRLLPLAFAVSAAAAISPMLIPFQGRLTDPQGVPYTNGQFTIVFNLYDQAVGGTRLWTETHYKVGVINGMVNVFLGSIESLTNVSFADARHLGITIDADGNPNTADPEMIPRQMIIPAFWAKQSDNSLKLSGFGWGDLLFNGATNPVTGHIDGAKIAPGTITGSRVANATLTAANIANGAVGSAQLASQAVQTANIANGAVGSTQLGSQAVQTANIANGAVGNNQLAPAITSLIGAGKISSIQNYGTSTSSGSTVNETDLKIRYGQTLMSGTSSQTITGLPFTSANSYTVIATRDNVNGYTSQAVTVAKTDGTSFVIKDFTVNSPINWIAIGN